MDRPAIADALTRITGTWAVGRGAADADLAAARSALAGLLLTESRPDDVRAALAGRAGIAPVEAGSRAAIERIVEQLPEAPSQDLRVFIRYGSVLDPAALAGVAGMKVSRTLGPFIDELGTAHLVDLIPIPRKIPIEGIAGALALLVLDRLPLPQPPEQSLALPHLPPQRIAIGPGSLWVAVHAVLGGTTTGYVGLAFAKGEVELVNVRAAPGGGLLLQAGSRLTLSLALAHPTPAPVVSPIGRDAAQMTVDLPATVTIVFQSTGAVFTAVGASSATVYGTGFTLTRNAAAPHLRSFDLSYLVLPCGASIPTFAIASYCLRTLSSAAKRRSRPATGCCR
jgi:hypothetical protein